MLLWEYDRMTVNHIAERLILKTNTVTPLLQRMESLGIIERNRDTGVRDTRKVYIRLTGKGKEMQEQAREIPARLGERILSENFTMEDLLKLQVQLYSIIDRLSEE